MWGLAAALLGVLYLRHRYDPNTMRQKRGNADVAFWAAGLLKLVAPGTMRPSGSGFVFNVLPEARGRFLECLERYPAATAAGTDFAPWQRATVYQIPANGCPGFLSGDLYWIHAKEVGCAEFGDCRDYRTLNGAIGPGSLQVVYNRRTGQGYFDYDRWNPYQSWWHFGKHAEEI